jgi:hypothetical protein
MNSLRMSFWIVPDSLSGHALFLGRDDVAGEHRQHGAVHGHRHAHLVERDAVEQDLHVLDRIDRHAGLADVADHPRMIGIVAAMGGEIEGHRQAHLAGREIGAIELVALFGGREAGILADRPGTPGVHRGLRSAGEGREARQRAHRLDLLEVGRGVERLHRDPFRGHPGEVIQRAVAQLLRCELFPVGEGLLRKIGHARNVLRIPGPQKTRLFVGQNRVSHQRVDLAGPAAAAEHAVMADAGLHIVLLAIGPQAGTEIVGGYRLA